MQVKTYVDFLTPFEKSSREGRLNFPDDFIEPILEKSGLQNAYNQDSESLEVMLAFLEKFDILSKKDIKIFKANEFAVKVSPVIKDFAGKGLSLNQIARELNKRDILTARGKIGSWTPTAVKNVIARWKSDVTGYAK